MEFVRGFKALEMDCVQARTAEFLVIDQMILNFDGKKDDSQGSDLRSTICVKVKSERKII